MSGLDLVDRVQTQIESIYGLATEARAADYLIGHDDLEKLVPAAGPVVPKELFLVNPNPHDGTLEIALFFHSELTDNLTLRDPMSSLSTDNISDFCALIEGVSHFVYYLHKAGLERSVTQLELELQAEIDKFVLLSFFVDGEPEAARRDLLKILFEDYSLYQNLSSDQQERYHLATKLAKRYCHKLSQNLWGQNLSTGLGEIREFYTLTQEEKIRRINDGTR